MHENTEIVELREKTKRYLHKSSVEDIPPEWRSSISSLLDELSVNHRELDKYRSYVENAPHGVFITDATGLYIQVNPAAREITGYREDELLSMRISDLIHPDGREEAVRDFEQLRTEGRVKVEEPFLHKSGEKRWWRVTAVKLSEDRYLGYTEDITEKRESEQKLQRAHRQFLTVLNSLDAGVFAVSQNDNTILYANRYVEDFFEEEITGKRCYDFFSEEGGHSCAHCADFPEEGTDGRFISMEYRIPGTETWFLMQVRGIKWIDGTLARLHILTDISAIKDRERLREDINRITRHDLKTPLNGILGASQLLLEEEMGDRHRRLVNLIEESGKRMMTIINQSLSLYKMEEGSYELQKDAVSCRLLINTIVDEILNSSEGRGKELRVSDFVCAGESAVAPQGKGSGTSREGICDDVMIQGEYNLCYSILTNLLKNAVEASEKGAAVEVGVRELDGEWVELTVWNGRPIPEEIRATFGSKYTTAGKKYGTGLGVYSARLMTEVQGGRLDWHSDESTGTTLKVILPKYPGSRAEVKRGAETS